MPLALYGHPFSSYTWKVLIALDENRTLFDFRVISPETPQHAADWARLWPIRQFPVLLDGDHAVAESTIIIEHLHLHHRGPTPLLPDDPRAALDVRFLDRLFDLHVMAPMQRAVEGALSGDPARGREGEAYAAEKLERAYALLETMLAARTWAAGEEFTMADCAAAPALFYADWTYRIGEEFPRLRAYRARLLTRPSVARVVDAARPYRSYFPLGAPDRD
ncbi:MAG: glutathione S-transferase family protein [Parvularculaceae bacterium]|nr:glutathione S-transferase family protein [Parvularculaceae bacterium]